MSISISGLGNAQAVSGASGRSGAMSKGLSRLFQQIDIGGTGSLTKAKFESAFAKLKLPASLKSMGAGALFDKLDPNGSGSITKQQFVDGMQQVFADLRAQQYGTLGQSGTTNPSGTLTSGLDALQLALGRKTSALTNSATGNNYTVRA